MSRKTVPFPVPGGPGGPGDSGGGRRRGPEVIDAHSDEWVSDRNNRANGSRGKESGPHAALGLMLDLAADRSLTEVLALTVITPIALGWFWLMNALNGRIRL